MVWGCKQKGTQKERRREKKGGRGKANGGMARESRGPEMPCGDRPCSSRPKPKQLILGERMGEWVSNDSSAARRARRGTLAPSVENCCGGGGGIPPPNCRIIACVPCGGRAVALRHSGLFPVWPLSCSARLPLKGAPAKRSISPAPL